MVESIAFRLPARKSNPRHHANLDGFMTVVASGIVHFKHFVRLSDRTLQGLPAPRTNPRLGKACSNKRAPISTKWVGDQERSSAKLPTPFSNKVSFSMKLKEASGPFLQSTLAHMATSTSSLPLFTRCGAARADYQD